MSRRITSSAGIAMSLLRRLADIFSKPADGSRSPRLLAYCASNIGIGHYARLTRVVAELRRRRPDLSALMMTDARDLSLADRAGIALLRVPGFAFAGTKFGQEPEHLRIGNEELRRLRRQLLLTAGLEFAPDLVLMDTLPHGKLNEMEPLLRRLRRAGRTRVILLMRDIPAPPGERFRLSGDRRRIAATAELYDLILIAGDRGFHDVAEANGWPDEVRARLHYIGFVTPPPSAEPRGRVFARFAGLDPARRTIVASLGGGWGEQGLPERLIDGVLEVRHTEDEIVQLVLITGPAMAGEQLDALRTRARGHAGIRIERFTSDFDALLQHADLALLQGGSTVYQLLETDKPIVLLCRRYKSGEQDMRARLLAHHEGVRVVDSEALAQTDIAGLMRWGLGQRLEPRRTGYSFNGPSRAAELILELLGPEPRS